MADNHPINGDGDDGGDSNNTPGSAMSAGSAAERTDEPMIKGRYVLHHCLSTTSLMALYWVHDEQAEEPDALSATADKNLLLAIINPAISALRGFEQAFRNNRAYFALPKHGQPHVIDDGKEPGGQLWFAMRDTDGILLSERLQELDDRSLPVDTANRIAHAIYQTTQSLQDQPYGFIEPGIIQKAENNTYKLLNAPIVRALQQTLSTQQEQKLALHSPYLSPSVAVGDLPVAEDDSFAIAAVYYELLTHQTPFAKRSTLEAAVHGDAPHTIKKLNEHQWQALKNALAFQRKPRPANPQQLLKQLNSKQRKKLVYPVAAVAALGISAFAVYHLIGKVGEVLPTDTQALQQQTDTAATLPDPLVSSDTDNTESRTNTGNDTQTPAQDTPPPASTADETTKPLLSPVATDTAITTDTDTATANAADIQQLLDKARQAIAANQFIATGTKTDTATTHLQAVLEHSPEHAGALALLNEVINEQHQQVQAALEARNYNQAEQQLEVTDALISEFALADFLIPQARLEATLENKLHKQTMIAQYLERAQAAMQRDKLTQGDEEGEGAVDYLRALLLEVPDHPEGQALLKDIVSRQHQQARQLMREQAFEEARSILDSSQRIIGRYRFDALAEKQLQLEDRYRDRQLADNMPEIPEPTQITRTPQTTAAPPPTSTQQQTNTRSTAASTSDNPRRREREQAAQAQRPATAQAATTTAATAEDTTPATASTPTNTPDRLVTHNSGDDDGLILLPMPEPQVSFESNEPAAPLAQTPAPAPTPATPTLLPDDAFDYALPAIGQAPDPQPDNPTDPAPSAPTVSYDTVLPAVPERSAATDNGVNTLFFADSVVNNQAIPNESTNNVQIPASAPPELDIPEIPLSTIDDGLPVLPLPPDDAAQ